MGGSCGPAARARFVWHSQTLPSRSSPEVVERLDRKGQIVSASRAFRAAIDLWSHGTLLHPDKLDWPTVIDRKDHWVLDLAWAATADFIISLDPDLTEPTMPFPVEVLEPDELLSRLVL